MFPVIRTANPESVVSTGVTIEKAWQVEVIKNRKAYKRGPFKTLARAEAAATRLREELGFLTGFGMKETQ